MALSEDGRFCVANYYPVLWFCCDVQSNLTFPVASGLGCNVGFQAGPAGLVGIPLDLLLGPG